MKNKKSMLKMQNNRTKLENSLVVILDTCVVYTLYSV